MGLINKLRYLFGDDSDHKSSEDDNTFEKRRLELEQQQSNIEERLRVLSSRVNVQTSQGLDEWHREDWDWN